MAEPQPKPTVKYFVRIAQVDIPGEKAIGISLQRIKGIGFSFAHAVCIMANIPQHKKAGTLTDEEVARLSSVLEQPQKYDIPSWLWNRRRDYETGEDRHLLTGSIGFVQDNDLKRLKKIRSYRGLRHMKGLPVRGQRTRSNFRRGKGKVVAVRKKEEAKKADK